MCRDPFVLSQTLRQPVRGLNPLGFSCGFTEGPRLPCHPHVQGNKIQLHFIHCFMRVSFYFIATHSQENCQQKPNDFFSNPAQNEPFSFLTSIKQQTFFSNAFSFQSALFPVSLAASGNVTSQSWLHQQDPASAGEFHRKQTNNQRWTPRPG